MQDDRPLARGILADLVRLIEGRRGEADPITVAARAALIAKMPAFALGWDISDVGHGHVRAFVEAVRTAGSVEDALRVVLHEAAAQYLERSSWGEPEVERVLYGDAAAIRARAGGADTLTLDQRRAALAQPVVERNGLRTWQDFLFALDMIKRRASEAQLLAMFGGSVKSLVQYLRGMQQQALAGEYAEAHQTAEAVIGFWERNSGAPGVRQDLLAVEGLLAWLADGGADHFPAPDGDLTVRRIRTDPRGDIQMAEALGQLAQRVAGGGAVLRGHQVDLAEDLRQAKGFLIERNYLQAARAVARAAADLVGEDAVQGLMYDLTTMYTVLLEAGGVPIPTLGPWSEGPEIDRRTQLETHEQVLAALKGIAMLLHVQIAAPWGAKTLRWVERAAAHMPPAEYGLALAAVGAAINEVRGEDGPLHLITDLSRVLDALRDLDQAMADRAFVEPL
jgi:hypothetical protein